MPVSLGVRLRDDGLDERLAELAGRLADREPALAEIGGELQTSTHQRFREQRGPDGEAWPGLAAATLGQRKGDRRRAKILRDTGELFNSISFQATADEVHVGTNKAYARIHQLGGQAGRASAARIPARPYLGVSEADRQTVADILSQYLGGR